MIETVAVIGAGVMGSAIAAHCANAGANVILLDIASQGQVGAECDRSLLARQAIERMAKIKPAPLMRASFASRITPGNLDDDLNLVSTADWIIEAVVEKIDIKHALYKQLDRVRKAGSIVSSNTSTIPLERLTQGLSDTFKADFLITHFFNPPRYMRLLELVPGRHTQSDAVADIGAYCDTQLGKEVIHCKDSPGFIANRIGTFFVETAIDKAIEMRIAIEDADAICGAPMGMPKTGVFGLCDLVGIDLLYQVGARLRAALPQGDALHQITSTPALLKALSERGRLGRKCADGGFYKIVRSDGRLTDFAIDLEALEDRPKTRPDPSLAASDLGTLLARDDQSGRYASAVLARTLAYAVSLWPEVSDSIADIDSSMRLGYNWRRGPFELVDAVGADWLIQACTNTGLAIPAPLMAATDKPFYSKADANQQVLGRGGVYQQVSNVAELSLKSLKRAQTPLAHNPVAAIWDLGDGVINLELTSKSNAITQRSFDILDEALNMIEATASDFQALVIYSDSHNFAAGADLNEFSQLVSDENWDEMEAFARRGQTVLWRMREAAFPVVSAVRGAALGGGCEIALHSTAVVAHAEATIGLVETSVGIVPAWGGCAGLLARHWQAQGAAGDPMDAIRKTFMTIAAAQTSSNAYGAQELSLLRESDTIAMNTSDLLTQAKARAMSLIGQEPTFEAPSITLPGPKGCEQLMQSVTDTIPAEKIGTHDLVVWNALAKVLTGGNDGAAPVDAQEALLNGEIAAALTLFKSNGTKSRIDHLLKTRRPLNN